MRVIGGIAKGKILKVPKSIRPTTDLVRGAIFSILEVDGARVLDLYAGSGALGIEALSRGARWADFVEREPRCCSIIKENLERTGFTPQAHVYCTPARRALSFLKGQYNIIFLDPPYSLSPLSSVMSDLASSPIMGGGCLVVFLHSHHTPLNSSYPGLKLIDGRRYGDTLVSLFRKEEG